MSSLAPKLRRSRRFKSKREDLFLLSDAVFCSGEERGADGWVEMYANATGRECIRKLFPGERITWEEPPPGMPADWQAFEINLPGVMGELPPHCVNIRTDFIPPDTSVNDLNPWQLCFILAVNVEYQGGRGAVWHDSGVDIYTGREH